MKEKTKNHNFTRTIFMRLWFPELISALGLALADMADALVLGRRMGSVGLAAIGLCLPLYMLMNLIMHGLGLGGSTFFSRYLGEGDEDRAKKSFKDTICPAIILGVILAVVGNIFVNPLLRLFGTVPADGALFDAARNYSRIIIAAIPIYFLNFILNYFMRNDNKQTIATIGFTVANILDVVLNIVFVLVFDWGTTGAALATLIGQVTAVLIYLPTLLSKKNKFICIPKGAINLKNTFRYFKNGLSVSVQYICQFIFLLVINNVLLKNEGEDGVAVFELLQSVSFLVYYIFNAASKAMQPLLSTYNGESNEKEIFHTRRIGFIGGMVSGGLLIAFIAVFPSLVCTLFGLTESSIIPLATRAIRIYCVSAIFAGLSTLIENYYQSCSLEKNSFVIALLRGTIILIPCTLIFATLGVKIIWYFYPVTEIASLLFFGLWLVIAGERMHITDRKKFVYEIENTNNEISGLSEAVCAACEEWGAPQKICFFSGMAAEEICLAIKEHNASNDQEEPVYIQITTVCRSNGNIELHFRDNGISFNPLLLNSGKVNEEDFDEAAMGMIVVKKQAKDFLYRKYVGFNTISINI